VARAFSFGFPMILEGLGLKCFVIEVNKSGPYRGVGQACMKRFRCVFLVLMIVKLERANARNPYANIR